MHYDLIYNSTLPYTTHCATLYCVSCAWRGSHLTILDTSCPADCQFSAIILVIFLPYPNVIVRPSPPHPPSFFSTLSLSRYGFDWRVAWWLNEQAGKGHGGQKQHPTHVLLGWVHCRRCYADMAFNQMNTCKQQQQQQQQHS